MKRNLEEWRNLKLPQGMSEEEANDWQAQVINEAVHDITWLCAWLGKLRHECRTQGQKLIDLSIKFRPEDE